MIERAISPRYAKALFDLDCLQGNLEKRLQDFESMVQLLKDHPKLAKLLKAPQVVLEDKRKALQDALKDRFDPIFLNFIFYLIQKGRLVSVSHIANEYKLMVNKYFGIWEGDIVTAVPIDTDSEAKLKEKLEKTFDKKIKLNKKIDPQNHWRGHFSHRK